MIRNQLIVVSILVLINGCASTSAPKPGVGGSKHTTANTRAYVKDESQVTQSDSHKQAKVITTASYDAVPEPVHKNKSVPASRDAVLDLLAQSKQAIDHHNYDEAENILKRALRIEPGNAWLWYNMAVVSFYQANYHQAIQQALKSNNLERFAEKLHNNNYKIIEQSYIELGEPMKAQSVREMIN